jgi:hypothetical protein
MLSLHRPGKKSVAGWVALGFPGLAVIASAQGGIWVVWAELPTPRRCVAANGRLLGSTGLQHDL